MGQSLVDVLSKVRGGFAMHKAGEKLQEVIDAVYATKQAGEVTLTIKVKPDKNDERVITVHPSIKAKVPEKGFSEGIFFYDEEKEELTTEDPVALARMNEAKKQGVLTLQREREQSEAALGKVGRGE